MTSHSTVTSPRHSGRVIVTELGLAHLHGLTTKERAASLVGVVRPRCEVELSAAAESLGR